jgi:hypothetical protein
MGAKYRSVEFSPVLDWLRWRWLKASWARLMFLEDIPAHHALLAAYKL